MKRYAQCAAAAVVILAAAGCGTQTDDEDDAADSAASSSTTSVAPVDETEALPAGGGGCETWLNPAPSGSILDLGLGPFTLDSTSTQITASWAVDANRLAASPNVATFSLMLQTTSGQDVEVVATAEGGQVQPAVELVSGLDSSKAPAAAELASESVTVTIPGDLLPALQGTDSYTWQSEVRVLNSPVGYCESGSPVGV